MDDAVTDDEIVRLLTDTRTWAVVGWSPSPSRASNGVASFLHRQGKRVLPVNPTCEGADGGLDAPAAPTLAALDEPIEVVDVFRRSAEAGVVVDEAIAVGAGAV